MHGRGSIYGVNRAWPFGLHLLGMTLLTHILSAGVAAQESPCDPGLAAPAGHPFGYRPHGDRCEGIYVQEVSGTTLRIASLTEVFENYDLTSGAPLLVAWRAPGGEVHLRAQGLRHRLYYRMDTVRPPGDTAYVWSADLLTALSIPRRDLGVVGWVRMAVGDAEQAVYVPLRIAQHVQGTPTGSYQLVLVPGRDLEEVYLSLGRAEADGWPHAFLLDGEPLQYGSYPALRGIAIPITGLEAPGLYYLEIGATLPDGSVASTALWFYHAGE